MKTKDKNFMYKVTRIKKVIELRSALWQNDEMFKRVYYKFKEKTLNLEQYMSDREGLIKPYGKIKSEILNGYCFKILQLAGMLHLIAQEQKLDELENLTNLTKTKLLGSSLLHFFSYSSLIISLGVEYKENLTPFHNGLTILEECKRYEAEKSFKNLEPFSRKKELKSMTANVKESIVDINNYIKKSLDKVVLLYATIDKSFFKDYLDSKRVVNIPATRNRNPQSNPSTELNHLDENHSIESSDSFGDLSQTN